MNLDNIEISTNVETSKNINVFLFRVNAPYPDVGYITLKIEYQGDINILLEDETNYIELINIVVDHILKCDKDYLGGKHKQVDK